MATFARNSVTTMILPFLRRCVLAVALLFAGLSGSANAAAPTPRAVVENFHATLLSVMKQADALQVKGRYDKLAPKMQAAFNLPLMIQVAAGTGWRSATDAQRSAMVAAFARMSASTYASRFDGYSGERFETVGERPGPRGMMLVETRIVKSGDEPVTLTYLTRKAADGWRIVDVLLKGGISELAVRRSEYRRILATGGANALVAALNKKADDLLR